MAKEMTKEAAEEILALPPRYSREDLRRAHVALARRYHPDAAARHNMAEDEASARMVEVNQAYELLSLPFADGVREVSRTAPGIASGYAGVGTPPTAGAWPVADDWGAPAPADMAATGLRAVVLGPWPARVLVLLALAYLWWRICPLSPHVAWPDVSGPVRLALAVAGIVYPTYAVVYELLLGYGAELVRETCNAIVSLLSRSWADLRRTSPTAGCALSKILREQAWALLLAPLVCLLAAQAVEQQALVPRVALALAATALAADALAACVRGGFVNVWSTILSDAIERRYLIWHQWLLRHCGATSS